MSSFPCPIPMFFPLASLSSLVAAVPCSPIFSKPWGQGPIGEIVQRHAQANRSHHHQRRAEGVPFSHLMVSWRDHSHWVVMACLKALKFQTGWPKNERFIVDVSALILSIEKQGAKDDAEELSRDWLQPTQVFNSFTPMRRVYKRHVCGHPIFSAKWRQDEIFWCCFKSLPGHKFKQCWESDGQNHPQSERRWSWSETVVLMIKGREMHAYHQSNQDHRFLPTRLCMVGLPMYQSISAIWNCMFRKKWL